MTLKRLMRDKITIKTANGETYSDVDALVQSHKIMTLRIDIPIRQGDQIIRLTPAGVEEIFIVEYPIFYNKFGGIPANYQLRVGRATPAPTKIISTAAPETFYSKAFRLLMFIDQKTRGKEEPIQFFNNPDIVKYKEVELSEEDTIAAWKYLCEKSLTCLSRTGRAWLTSKTSLGTIRFRLP
jgi:hypothetical protein